MCACMRPTGQNFLIPAQNLGGGGREQEGGKKEKKQEQRTQCESYSNVTEYTTGTELYWQTYVDQYQLIRDK